MLIYLNHSLGFDLITHAEAITDLKDDVSNYR